MKNFKKSTKYRKKKDDDDDDDDDDHHHHHHHHHKNNNDPRGLKISGLASGGEQPRFIGR